MISVLILVALIWWGGRFLGMAPVVRQSLLAVLYFVVLAVHLTLPPTAPLRINLGGSALPWFLAGAAAAVIYLYVQILRRLKKQAEGKAMSETPEKKGAFNATELNRYARHIVLREIGGAGQKKIKASKVLVIGAGGLGAPALQYLAAAGVGTIGVIDDDVVENANLQRQVIHWDKDIGTPKVFSAQAAMEAQNPFVTVRPYHRRLTEDITAELFAEYDLILDGTDNFETRYLANRVAVELGKPLISGALTQWEGQISLFDPTESGPCYQCIFPEAPAPGLAPACAEAGVIAPLPGVVGAMMGVEALKQITGAGETLRGAMLIYDALYAETRRIALKPRADCPICQGKGAQ